MSLAGMEGYYLTYSFSADGALKYISYVLMYENHYSYDEMESGKYARREQEEFSSYIENYLSIYSALLQKYGDPYKSTTTKEKFDVRWKIEYPDSYYYVEVKQYVSIGNGTTVYSNHVGYTLGDIRDDIRDNMREYIERKEKLDNDQEGL